MVRKISVLTIMLFVIGLVINLGGAQAIPIDIGIQNAGFEETYDRDGDPYQLAEGNYTYTTDPSNRWLPDWDKYQKNLEGDRDGTVYYGAWNPSTSNYASKAPEGGNVGYIEMESGVSGIAGLQQTISGVSLSAGDYWLQVDVGNNKNLDFPEYRIEVEAADRTFSNDTPTPNDNQFVTSQTFFTFGSDFTGDLTIRLLSLKLSSNDHTEVDFDNVRVVSDTPLATPEPATMLLLGAGLMGLAGFGRKKLFRK